MHGIIFSELKKFVKENMGAEGWRSLLKDAFNDKYRMYLPTRQYPDGELVTLVDTASKSSGIAMPDLLNAFGEFIAPALLNMYRTYVRPEWKALDLLENTEETIHKVVRLREKDSAPPRLKAERKSPDELVIYYSSERKLCHVAAGIASGVGKAYRENLTIEQKTCMHRGDEQCEIVVKAAEQEAK